MPYSCSGEYRIVSSQDVQTIAPPTGDPSADGSNLVPSRVSDNQAPDCGTPSFHPHQLTDGRNRGKTEDVPAGAKHKAFSRRPRMPKPPKDSRVYKMAVAAMALRYQGIKWPDISEQLGLQRNTLETYIKISRKKGWLADVQFIDPDDAMEFTIKDRVVRNLRTVLDETTTLGEGDDAIRVPTSRAVEVTLEAAKGTGMFKQHQAVKVESNTNFGVALRVQVEHAPAASQIQIREGSIGGTPAIEGEIMHAALEPAKS